MLHELFITHCTNGTSTLKPFTFIKDSYNHETLLGARKLERLEIHLANLTVFHHKVSSSRESI